MSRRRLNPIDNQAVVDALMLMMRLRSTMPYRSRGFVVLNAACHRLSERFWAECGIAPPRATRTAYSAFAPR